MGEKINVINIGSDRKLFEEGSAVRERVAEQGKLFDSLHIVVFTLKRHELKMVKISDNVRVYPTNSWSRFFYPFAAAWVTTRIIKKEKIKKENGVITTQDPFESGLAGLLVKFRRKIPLHVQIHTDFLNPKFKAGIFLNSIRLMLASFVIPQANALRVVSKNIKDSIIFRYKFPEKRIVILPIFVDITRIRNTVPAFDIHEKYPGFSIIGFMASRLTLEKDIFSALQAFKEASADRADSALVIAGSGPLENELKNQARALGIGERVFFIGWQTDLIPYMKTADFFLLTSTYEGYGMTLVEAAASGASIISTDVGIAREIIKDDESGFVCRVGDAMCLRERMKAIFNNGELKMRFREAIEASVERFVLNKIDYLKAYQASIAMAQHSYEK